MTRRTDPTSPEPTGLERRDVLRLGALLGFCGLFTPIAQALGPGLPERGDRQSIYAADYPLEDPRAMVMGTCAGCLGGCAVKAQRELGVLAKVDGNPFSPRQYREPAPLTLERAARLRGTSCGRGQARVQNVHDPYRLVRPLRRQGPRGGGDFATLEGAELLALLLEGMDGGRGLDALHQAARGGSDRSKVLIAVDPRHQDRRPLLEAFARSVEGVSVVLGHPAPTLARATGEVLGEPGWLATPRWERATVAVAWGSDPVSSGLDPVGSAWWWAQHRRTRKARLISVDPRLSTAGGMADSWVPVRPGGDLALAGWIARIWAEEGWIVDSQVPVEVRGRPTDSLARITGLGERMVNRLAWDMWEAGPALAIHLGGGAGPAAAAVLRLAALAGAMDAGGAMEPVADPTPAVDGAAELARRLTEEPPELLVLVGDPGVLDKGWETPVVQALADPQRLPMVVAVTTAMNELAWWADLVVPDLTEFERTGLVRRHDGSSLVLPAIEPVLANPGLDDGLGGGLATLLQDLVVGCGGTAVLADAIWEQIHAEAGVAEPLPLEPEQLALLRDALQDRVPEAALQDPAVASFLARGWLPPQPAGTPPQPPLPELLSGGALSEPGGEGPYLIAFREPFGGQSDSDAQAWGARAVRQDNPLQVQASLLDTLEGHHSDQLALAQDGTLVRVKETQTVRPDTVALARGYGRVRGFDGQMRIDGEPVPAAPRRCCGVAVGPLLTQARQLHLRWGPPVPQPSVWDLLKPGGVPPLPGSGSKHG